MSERRADLSRTEAAALLAQMLRAALPGLKADTAKHFGEFIWKAARDRRDEDDRRQEQRRHHRRQERQDREYWSARDHAGASDASPWAVLGVPFGASAAEVQSAWRKLVVSAHPDRGGSHERMAAINAARDALMATQANPSRSAHAHG